MPKGLYRAVCVENVDTENRGRIKFRAFHNEDVPVENLPWAECCSPFGGGNNIDGAGFFFIPEVGSQVWILNEQDNDAFPVWFGSSFFKEAGRQNLPIEAKPTSVEPTIRMIKSVSGNKLTFDDRPAKENGDPIDNIRLENRQGSGLVINEPGGSGRGIRLGFGTQGGELKFTREGARFKSNLGAGFFINDITKLVSMGDETGKSFLQISGGNMVGQAPNGIKITTDAVLTLEGDKGINFKTAGGLFSVKSSNQKYTTAVDFTVQTGGNFNVNSTQFNMTGQLGSNFWLDLPIPGIPGLFQGNIVLTTSGGGILLRNGLPNPAPVPPVLPLTFTNNDPLFPTLAGRLAIGDLTSGNALLEGRLGGIFISGTPLTLPGTAGGLGGRAPAPNAPIVPTGTPGAPQPAVLGGNLFQLLTQLNTQLQTFLTLLISNAPAFATSPVGPCILSPGVVTGISTLQSALITLQQTYFNPAPGTPTNILSSYVFVDG